MQVQQVLEKYIPLVSNMLAASFIFATALLTFLVKENLDSSTAIFWHYSFYCLSLINIFVLLNFNRGDNLFICATILAFYVIINALKMSEGADFEQISAFQNLKALLPFNILIFYLFPTKKFVSKKSYLYLCGLFAEYTVCEFLSRFGLVLEIREYGIPVVETIGYLSLFGCALVRSIRTGTIYDYTILFCAVDLFCALFFAVRLGALSLFFCMAQLLLSTEICYVLIYNYFYDATGIYSRNSYLRQAKHLPQKYAFGIIKIDNYLELLEKIGCKYQKVMDKLICSVIQEMAVDAQIYRYTFDTYILIYKTLDKKELYRELDSIRHRIAGAIFEYVKNKKNVKLTVTCSATEKKRSDADIENVFRRADEKLQETLKFSHNITVTA